jgi:hypothetical protein
MQSQMQKQLDKALYSVTLQKMQIFLSPVDLMISNTIKHECTMYCETTEKANQMLQTDAKV